MAITRDEFVQRCTAEKMLGGWVGHGGLYWRVPILYLLCWVEDTKTVCIVTNTPTALEDVLRYRVAEFDNLDAAFATYTLLNP